MPFLETPIGKIAFEITEESTGYRKGSVIFIHGAGGDRWRWQNQLQDHFPGWDLIAIDLPGHGNSEGKSSASIDEYANAVTHFLDKFCACRPCFLAGHSMGGAIVLQTALSHPSLVDGLILIGTGARLRVHPQLLSRLAEGNFDPQALRIAYGPTISSELLEQELKRWGEIPVALLLDDFTACDRFDTTARLPELNVPTLIVVGEHDQMTPVKYSQFLHQQISHSVLQVIPAAGHHVMLENPTDTNQAIREFLNTQSQC